MYNGIGLTTPRGSGTNGYVVRNLSHLRSHDTAADRLAFEAAPMKHREPDQEILEHERKRKVEVACYELQVKLEDEEVPEEEIESRVDELRARLLAQSNVLASGRTQFKPSDTHAILAAKKVEMERMARALGTSKDYVEGRAFDSTFAEEQKKERIAQREERERQQEIARKAREDNEKAWKEKERLRRRDEDRLRGGARGQPAPKDAAFVPPRDRRDRSNSPPIKRAVGSPSAGRSRVGGPPTGPRERSPPPRRKRSRTRSRSVSPHLDRRRSPSVPRKRGASRSVRGRTRTRSPPNARSRSKSPRDRVRRDLSMSRSRSPRSDSTGSRRDSKIRKRSRSSSPSSRSRSPPRKFQGGRGTGRGGRFGRGGRQDRSPHRSPRQRSVSPRGPRRRFSPQARTSRYSPPRGKRGPPRKVSRSPSPHRPGGDTRMKSQSPKHDRKARSASPTKSDGSGSVAMDESD